MSVWSIVVAAGSGTRFGGPKQVAPLGGRRVVDWAVRAAADVSNGVVLVVSADLIASLPVSSFGDVADKLAIIGGGESRSESVRAGLAVVPATAQIVVVHDGARPLADGPLFGAVIHAVRGGAAGAITAVPVTDTIRHETDGTIDRSVLRSVQTPQAFWADALRKAHAAGGDATDDASLVEANGGHIVVVDGAPGNIKITAPTDLVVAEALLADRHAPDAPVEAAEGDE